MAEAPSKFLAAVGSAVLSVRDRHSETFPAAFRNVQRVGGSIPFVGHLAVEGVHLYPKSHIKRPA